MGKQDLLKDYASIHASSLDYDIDQMVEDTKPELHPLSVDRTSQGAVVTDVRTVQLDASYGSTIYLQRVPLFVVELKPVQYVRQREQRQAVWLRMNRRPRSRYWQSRQEVWLRTNWRKFAVKAERGWNQCVHSE